uniref:Transposon Ty3-I Gag-Pol polyprotein n=1 Tax=Cajanus cajan TaxID=3821 RepID=A0A151R1N7_CAJCA|nr:Transposon Ty3-I Gag-Pol polyprotein [Cajanus cajan]
MYWWTSLWDELRSALRMRHIPPYYEHELTDKLQRLKQGSSSVEEYRKSMELLMMRVGIREEERTTISRFQSGLNLEIRDKFELLPYRDLYELVQLCSRVEHQLKRKSFRKDSTLSYSKNFKKEGPSSKPFPNEKEKEKERPSLKASSKDTKTSDIKCFKCLGRGHIASKCPTKKTMILRGQDHYSSLDEAISSSSILESKEETYPCEGDLLMLRRLLGNQSSDLDKSQRENFFYTRCKCSLIVDSGSSCNCCSTKLVKKLALTTLPHPKPYNLQWINEEGGILVNQQVNIPISIGKYKDEVLCDIVPLDASHILLGRPWKFDKKTIHEGLTNKISFHHLGKKIVLCPLSPSQNKNESQERRRRENKKKKQKSKKNLPLNEEREEKVSCLEASVSSKEVVHKSHLPLKNDIKKTLLCEQPLYLLYFKETLAATSHELETNPQETKEIESQVDDLLKKGWVQKSLSPCVVLVLLVPKKDGKWRMCTDCRAINNITIKYRHPIPRLDDILDKLHRAIIFSKIDLKSGYHQIPIKDGKEIAHVEYEWLVMPFGLTNAPSTFMHLMNHILRDCIEVSEKTHRKGG